jgi:hypothetical protein
VLRDRRLLALLAVLVAGGVLLSGCGGSSGGRPTTDATLRFVTPTPNAVSGTDVVVRVRLDGARVVPATQVGGTPRPDRGHIHVSLDGQLVAMSYGDRQVLPNVAPGRHTLQAEFVATDHLPFANRVVTAVTFSVR